MKKLRDKFKRSGFTYQMIARTTNAAIYLKSSPQGSESYEVFHIRMKKGNIVNGKVIPDHERFPSDEDFGKWAWSYKLYKKALQRFIQLGGRTNNL